MVLSTEWAQVEVIDLINDGSGLAFGIIGGRSTGVVVKTIVPGGVADRDGRLQSGDHILQIGEVNLRGLGSEQVASVLRQCGVHVRMVVARPVDCSSADEFEQTLVNTHAPVVPTKILGDPVELDKHLIANGYGDIFASIPPSNTYTTPYIFTGQQTDAQLHTVPRLVDVVRNPLSYGTVPVTIQNVATKPNALPLDVSLRKQPNLPETETYAVQLCKDDLGLGITIAGYVCEKEELSGIFVKSISKGSAADTNGMIKVNDRIVQVDGVSVIGRTNHQAVEILRNTGPLVTISFERYLRGPKYEQLQQAIRANELKPPSPPSPSVSSLPKVPVSSQMNSATIEPEGESRTSVDFSAILLDTYSPTNEEVEIVIDGCSRSVQFSIASHESIYEKWRQSLKDDLEIVIAELTKDSSSGLGISLEGTVDVEDGQEVRPHHYIRNILPNGPVGKNGILHSGDELLEVNGIQLLGLNHLEVVSILKQLPGFVLLVCARSYVPTRIIDTAQRRDAFKARNILAGSLQTLIPANSDKLVKAKSDSSIASSFASEVGCAGLMSRSRSLELITGLPMWSDAHLVVELVKGDHGLGFSILDYQDPLNPEQTVIVIRSLIPGGVAQIDGRLIPGDRLIAVNDVNVERVTLDRAVQVLKCAPKGTVKITVAKPASTNESHHSQDTDQEDQTCLDDFQECLEEYQECLEVVQICFDDDVSYNHSSCMSQFDDLVHNGAGGVQKNNLLSAAAAANNSSTKNISESELSFKSVCDNNNEVNHPQTDNFKSNVKHLVKSDSTQSEKVTLTLSAKTTDEISEKDGYETCLDESLSDETSKIPEEKTPTNSKVNLHAAAAQSEPCLSELPRTNHLCLDTKLDHFIDERSGDEFFLLQYSRDDVIKCCSNFDLTATTPTRYQRCIKEYYNDYEECLESYRMYAQCKAAEELPDDLIFGEILLPFKSRSAPNILDRSFVTLTYDPGPENYVRRKSAFVSGYPEDADGDPMTVTRGKEVGATGSSKRAQVTEMLQKHWGSIKSVQINRDPDASLGISIVGGKVDLHSSDSSPETILGIFVKHVVPNSPAGRTGQLNTGDRILEVSGVDLRETSHEKAVEAIRNAPNPVTFLIQSLIPWNVDENSESREDPSPYPSPIKIKPPEEFRTDEESSQKPSADECQTGTSNPPLRYRRKYHQRQKKRNDRGTDDEARSRSSFERRFGSATVENRRCSDDSNPKRAGCRQGEEDAPDRVFGGERRGGGRARNGRKDDQQKGEEIDRASAANVRRTKEEIAADPEEEDHFGYTMNKVKKKYASLGHTILMVQLERSGQGLGLSLAGHKDRNCMAVFVCGINPTGAAYRTGGIQVGDEILEVNGVVLHGRCHLNASAIIKGLSGPIFKVIILRRKTAIDDIAVRPITQFPVSLAEEASEEYICSYPNVRTVTARKGPQGLGIMIIEGKHTDVGQGIFISDIQEGSAAEKAGLEIGEMILAVNKEPLLGSNYENAASLLKRTEGLVALIVSNPTKKVSTPAHAADENAAVLNDVGLGASATISTTLVPNIANTSSTAPAVKPAFKSSAPPSRPTTPVPEPPADPSTCPVHPGKETAIEISSDNKTLGLFFIGGKDTHIPEGIIVVEVYPGGAADKDGRLEAGDQILDVNGTSLKDASFMTALQALRQTLPKMKLTVYRPEKLSFQTIDVDLVKKPGKGVGLSFIARKSGKGVYVSEVLNGGSADVDGKILKGDLLISVNGQSVENSPGEETGAILKTVMGRITLKLHRYKPTNR